MSTPQEGLESDLKAAMKERQAEKVGTLRLLLTAVKNERIRLGRDIDEGEFTAQVRKAIKQRQEAAELYRQGQREDLAEKEEGQILFLEPYLPAQVSEETLRQAIADFVAKEGLSGPKAMGPVMKKMMADFGASADGATISRLAKELLSD